MGSIVLTGVCWFVWHTLRTLQLHFTDLHSPALACTRLHFYRLLQQASGGFLVRADVCRVQSEWTESFTKCSKIVANKLYVESESLATPISLHDI